MAIVKCKHCGHDVDEDDMKCPHCLSLGPNRSKKIRRNMLIVAGLLVIGFAYGLYRKSQEVERPYEEVAKEAHEDKLTQRGIAASLLLKSRLVNPASMKITKAMSNEDGSNLCFEFTQTDAAGKLQKSRAVVYEGGEPSMKASDWRLFCEHKSIKQISMTVRPDDD